MSDPEGQVRCPNCQNLLPELTGYSRYQCGGCGTVLRVKDKNFEVDVVSGNFDLVENRNMRLSDGSYARSNDSSVSMIERMEIMGKMHDEHVYSSMVSGDMRIFETDEGMDESIDGSSTESGDSNSEVGFVNGSQRSDRRLAWRSGEKGRREHFRGTQRRDVGRVRYSSSMHSNEGSSELGHNYDYAETAQFVKNRSDLDELKKVEYVEQERAEISRKMDELKDQLSRIDVASKPKEKFPTDRRGFHQDPYSNPDMLFSDGYVGPKRASMQYSGADKHVAGPLYISHYNEPPSVTDSHEMAMHNFYPPIHTPNQMQGFEDPIRSQMPRRPSFGVPTPLQQQYPHPYYSAQYGNSDMANLNTLKPYSHNINMHPPSCSCLKCYNKHPQVRPPVTSSVYRDRRYLGDPSNPMLYPRENSSVHGPQDYNPSFANLPLRKFHNSQWPGDQNLEVGVSNHPKAVPSSGGRHCYPIAGGAPFFACCSCFELLRLPKNYPYREKSRQKMRCAACSKLIFLAVTDKKLVLSLYEEAKESPAKVDDSSYMATKNSSYDAYNGRLDVSSDDNDNSGYDIHSADRKQVSASPEKGLSSSQSAGVRSVHSTSSCTSENEDNINTLISTNRKSNSAELPAEAIPPRPPSGSPLQEHIDYSTKYNLVNRSEKGSKNVMSEQEMGMPIKVISRQDSAVATELDISSNEYFNTGTSTDSGDISREEEDQRRRSPFFAGIIRKSFEERSGNNVEEEIANVTVNGHPRPDRLVKKAEKFAGLIQPGEYWYDSRAGFWGVMGGPCLGIIPPSIEEFNFPMSKTCSGGNTGVFVNGRELHQKDLNLLGKRGLPTDRDRSYIVEVSGRVLDEDSGEELDSLGKLAPTVEKTKRGFGMRTPRAAR